MAKDIGFWDSNSVETNVLTADSMWSYYFSVCLQSPPNTKFEIIKHRIVSPDNSHVCMMSYYSKCVDILRNYFFVFKYWQP